MGFDFTVQSDTLTQQLAAVTTDNSERRKKIDENVTKNHAAELEKQQLKAALLECDRVDKEQEDTGKRLIDTTNTELAEEKELLKLRHELKERIRMMNARTNSIEIDLKKVTDKQTAEAELVRQA